MSDAYVFSQSETIVESRPAARSNVLVWVLLPIIMLFGGYFRFVGLNWDGYTHMHPDERFLTSVSSSLGRLINPMTMTGTEVENQAQYQNCLTRYPQDQGVSA
jgi:hypothetical protein